MINDQIYAYEGSDLTTISMQFETVHVDNKMYLTFSKYNALSSIINAIHFATRAVYIYFFLDQTIYIDQILGIKIK